MQSADALSAQLVSAGMSDAAARAKGELYARCIEVLSSQLSGAEAHTAFYVPGRIELLGKHTDYAGGRSLLCTVERGFIAVARPCPDATLRVADARTSEVRELSLGVHYDAAPGDWSNYVAAVAHRVARNFPQAQYGADIAFASDLPPASGMSSSSALMIALFLVLSHVNDLPGDPQYRAHIPSQEALATYLATVENGQSFGALTGDRGVGTFGGSEDHTAILCCRAGLLSQYAFDPVRLERTIPFPAGHVLVIAYSGVAAPKTGSALASYNEAALAVRRILQIWNQTTDRKDRSLAKALDSGTGARERLRSTLATARVQEGTGQRLLDRLDQFVLESNDLVLRAGDAIVAGALDPLGDLVDQSQHAAETQLGNQIPETISLTRLARGLGALAASAFGAGFGGSVWALVPSDDADHFAREWRNAYRQAHPAAAAHAEFFTSAPGPPAMPL